MNTKLLYFIILLIFLGIYKKQIKIETYSSNYNINKSYINIKENIRPDLTSNYIHTISPMRSIFIYNYLFNLNQYSLIYILPESTLEDYIDNICFISNYRNSWNNNFSYNLTDGIIKITNNILSNYFDCDKTVNKTMKLKDYVNLLKKYMKLQLKKNIIKYVNYKLYILSNNYLFDRIIDIIIENQDDELSLNNITDFIINDIDEKKLFKLQTKKDYDDIDILFEGIDQTLVNHINNKFRKNYSTILNLSLYKIKNLYYSGEINKYDFSDKYCK